MAKLRFAIIVENDVAGAVEIEEGYSEVGDRIIAAYQSDPKIVPVSDPNVGFGWTFDGTNFIAPQE